MKPILVKSLIAAALVSTAACAPGFVVYQPPVTGPTATITFANASENQPAAFTTFLDAASCSGRQAIHFNRERTLPAGSTRTITVQADREFTLLTSLNTMEDEDYSIELGVTGSGPEPVLSRRFSAIGCNALISFAPESDRDYYVAVSGPASAGTCSIAVSELFPEGMIAPIKTRARVSRDPWGDARSYCD